VELRGRGRDKGGGNRSASTELPPRAEGAFEARDKRSTRATCSLLFCALPLIHSALPGRCVGACGRKVPDDIACAGGPSCFARVDPVCLALHVPSARGGSSFSVERLSPPPP
jgi:hypothetical protein